MNNVDVVAAADQARRKRDTMLKTVARLKARLSPKLIVADAAAVAFTHSIGRVTSLKSSPKQRKHAIIIGAAAFAASVGLRLLASKAGNKPATGQIDDDRRGI